MGKMHFDLKNTICSCNMILQIQTCFVLLCYYCFTHSSEGGRLSCGSRKWTDTHCTLVKRGTGDHNLSSLGFFLIGFCPEIILWCAYMINHTVLLLRVFCRHSPSLIYIFYVTSHTLKKSQNGLK